MLCIYVIPYIHIHIYKKLIVRKQLIVLWELAKKV